MKRSGFTLLEFIVVLAIFAVLVGLLLGAIQRVRQSALRMDTSNRIRQLGLALHSYELDQKHWPSSSKGYVTFWSQDANLPKFI